MAGAMKSLSKAVAAATVALAASGGSAAAAECEAPPGRSALDQYCEVVPGPDGTGTGADPRVPDGGSLIPPDTRRALLRSEDGQALLRFADENRNDRGGRARAAGGDAPPAARAEPDDSFLAAVGASLGAGPASSPLLIWILVAVSLGMFAVKLVGSRR